MKDHVLIVDDEPIIRNGLKSFIDWEKLGLAVEGDSANGLAALELLRDRPVDILITDIKMPVMDGLELTREALKINPDLQIVLISSYNEFDYVREGMKHGAVDYLLKPTLEADELIAVLLRCKERLAGCRKQADEKTRLARQTSLLERKRIEQDIVRLLAGAREETRFADLFGRRGAAYVCAYVMADCLSEWGERYGNLHASIVYEDLQALFYEQFQTGSAPILAGEGLLLLYPRDEGAGGHSIERFKARAEAELGLSVSAGYCEVEASERLETAYRRSRAAAERRFFEGTGRVFVHDGTNDGTNGADEAGGRFEEMNRHAMLELVRAEKDGGAVLDGFVARWRREGPSPEQTKREACELLSAFAYASGDTRTVTGFRDGVWRCDTVSRLGELMRALVREMEQPNRLRLNDNGHGGQLVAKAVAYIERHYRDDLTLQDVADSVHVSKSYFSNLFKKQTGQNFIDYLIDLRIGEAKRLLVRNECRIYEVAEKAGFNDVKYFSKLFKKTTQMTPVEYREKHQR
ncbi:response regulator transcription factor [Paenibacillus arenilitoris]|uniref:Response regulator n=1 Tax=Paenibacillus arenilitoris TaxID=2772299 RepID=A0A927CMJ6_9BACL|nr:response regulator [Paenibacillus arenilitoris]MBD2868911.1 response regulator [Paenibacillus arenilitoris]